VAPRANGSRTNTSRLCDFLTSIARRESGVCYNHQTEEATFLLDPEIQDNTGAVTESTDLTYIMALLFIIVFVLNLLPAFAPPTWTTMSFIGLAVPNIDVLLLAFIAAIAATSGRVVLAKLSHAVVRQKLLTEQTRRNVDAIRIGIESRRAITVSTFLGYSLSPLPSNYLFIAYGLTSLPIALLAAPFFVGRLVSYAFWTGTASTVGDWLDWDWFESAPYFAAYFLLSQLLLLPVIYGFTRLDWQTLFAEKQLKWLEKPK
jgi:membrane protein YqaA with SNARE-associated domain